MPPLSDNDRSPPFAPLYNLRYGQRGVSLRLRNPLSPRPRLASTITTTNYDAEPQQLAQEDQYGRSEDNPAHKGPPSLSAQGGHNIRTLTKPQQNPPIKETIGRHRRVSTLTSDPTDNNPTQPSTPVVDSSTFTTQDEITVSYAAPNTYPLEGLPVDRTKEELQCTKANFEKVVHENRMHQVTIQSLQHQLNHMECELQEYKTMSIIRGKELIDARAFSTNVDVLSISDIKDMVNTLNDEISQASDSLAGSLFHHKRGLTPEEIEAAFADICRTVSEPLARVLVKETKKPVPEINSLLAHVILEMLLVHFCSSKIQSWFPDTRENSDFLTAIYSEIRQTEEQAVSGRWRALTRAQIRPTSATWKAEFIEGLNNILKVAQWEVGNMENFIVFEQKLAAIFKAAEELRLGLGEKVVSIDIEVHIVRPGIPFDHRWMQDGYGDVRQENTEKSDEFVAGTTGIGLKQVITSGTAEEEKWENILSPKVVLVSTLREGLVLLVPPPVKHVVDMMLALRNEIANISNFLAENIKPFSYELFQDELDRCSQDSKSMVGEWLSNFLHEHSEAEELSQALIKITTQIFIVSFCASEWESYLDRERTTLNFETNVAQNRKERKAVFLKNLIILFKVAAWVIPGAPKRTAFEESLNPFFQLMEETEAAWKKIPEFTKVSLSFVPPGDDFVNSHIYEEVEMGHGIQTSNVPSSLPQIVLGTAALGVRCLFHHREERARTFLPAKVFLEEHLWYIRASDLNTLASQRGDGRDPY